MTNISKRSTDSANYKAALRELSVAIAKLNHKTTIHFLNELFTESEQIMLVKRFGAICMFSQHYSPYRVSLTLGLSQPTTARLLEQYEEGKYNHLINSVSKKSMSSFLSLLNDLIIAQANPRARARLMDRALGTAKY